MTISCIIYHRNILRTQHLLPKELPFLKILLPFKGAFKSGNVFIPVLILTKIIFISLVYLIFYSTKPEKNWKLTQTAPFRLLDVFCPSDRDRWYRLKGVFLGGFKRTKLGNMSVISGFKYGPSRFFKRPKPVFSTSNKINQIFV